MNREMRAATTHQFEYILAGTFRPENIDRIVTDLASHNYNAVQVCVRAPGVHYYPSEIAPVHPYCREYDFLGEFVAKAHKAGLHIHSYYPVFLEGDPPVPGADGTGQAGSQPAGELGGILAAHPEWASVGSAEGELRPVNWGCPSNDAYVDYVAQVAKEQVSRYELDAVIWDFLRFRHRCFCEHCQSKFRQFWHGRCLSPTRLTGEETELRCHVVVEDLKKLNAAVRSVKRDMKIGVYTFPYRRGSIMSIFQDWLAFTRHCDFVAPMYYGSISHELLGETLREQAELAACPLVLGLLPSRAKDVKRGTPQELCEDVEIAREAGYEGFFMLGYEALFGWERSGTYSSEYWHTPQPQGAARRITERIMPDPALPLWTKLFQ